MNKSIRSKLFIFITFLLIFFSALLWIVNSVYFEQYYINKKKSILIQNVKNLASMYKGNILYIQDELDRTANITGSNIDIINKKGQLIYNSSRRMLEERDIINNVEPKERPKPPLNAPLDINVVDKYPQREYIFETRKDIKLKIDFFAFVTKLNNEDILTIRVPLVSIRESVDIANKFVVITGIIIIILESAGAYMFSRKFTQPILELNSIAPNMAKFDFSKKCNISGKDEIGQLGQSVNYLSDELCKAITELNIKNQQLEKDIEKERKIDEMRKEFISSVSHELRTPLALIQGYSEGLISNVAENEEDRKFYCGVIMDETNKMNKLVKDLLNLSQIESGYFQIEKSEFNLISLIEDVLNKYKSIFMEKNINMQYEIEERCIVYGDRERIEQVLINYVNNAINHVD
ncbi:sensor histidine kinase [Clostridium lundense]|uniref:sensor histidine kinase n=1 Tax=Clostridium lundense TaxID=319475 RepID=UPI0006865317|nr:histidine kinase dimerization/phospho-acceptor domain-containing protein [Clostridium lundense]